MGMYFLWSFREGCAVQTRGDFSICRLQTYHLSMIDHSFESSWIVASEALNFWIVASRVLSCFFAQRLHETVCIERVPTARASYPGTRHRVFTIACIGSQQASR